jgi:arginine repressor
MHELEERLNRRGWKLEWADIFRDLKALEEVKVRHNGKRYLLCLPKGSVTRSSKPLELLSHSR